MKDLAALTALGGVGCCFTPEVPETRVTPPAPPPSSSPPSPSAPSSIVWDPARTVVFAAGLLRWARADLYDAMPPEERRDRVLVDTWIARGVPRARVTHLEDDAATLAHAREALLAAITSAGPEDTFLFYWAGHGDRTESGASYAVPFDAGDDSATSCLGYDDVVRTIETHGRMARALLFADTCYSGAVAEAVVARHGGPARAGFGASSASESSTGNWTFTDALIAAFGGAANADRDRDRAVTTDDLAALVQEEMAFADGQLATVRFAEGFPTALRLADAAAPPCPRYGERIEVLDEGTWWPATITGQSGDQLDVHYDGYTAQWDRRVSPSETRPYAPTTYPNGTRLTVRWEDTWYPAVVRDSRLGVHLVHYDGFADTWDEWVSRDRIRAT